MSYQAMHLTLAKSGGTSSLSLLVPDVACSWHAAALNVVVLAGSRLALQTPTATRGIAFAAS